MIITRAMNIINYFEIFLLLGILIVTKFVESIWIKSHSWPPNLRNTKDFVPELAEIKKFFKICQQES